MKKEKLTEKALLLEFFIWQSELDSRFKQGDFAKLRGVTSGRVSQIKGELEQSLREFMKEFDLDMETRIRVFEHLRERFPDKKPKDI